MSFSVPCHALRYQHGGRVIHAHHSVRDVVYATRGKIDEPARGPSLAPSTHCGGVMPRLQR